MNSFFSCNNHVHSQHKCGSSQFSPHADFRLATVRPLFCPFSLPNLGPNLALCLAHRSRGWTLYYTMRVFLPPALLKYYRRHPAKGSPTVWLRAYLVVESWTISSPELDFLPLQVLPLPTVSPFLCLNFILSSVRKRGQYGKK